VARVVRAAARQVRPSASPASGASRRRGTNVATPGLLHARPAPTPTPITTQPRSPRAQSDLPDGSYLVAEDRRSWAPRRSSRAYNGARRFRCRPTRDGESTDPVAISLTSSSAAPPPRALPERQPGECGETPGGCSRWKTRPSDVAIRGDVPAERHRHPHEKTEKYDQIGDAARGTPRGGPCRRGRGARARYSISRRRICGPCAASRVSAGKPNAGGKEGARWGLENALRAAPANLHSNRLGTHHTSDGAGDEEEATHGPPRLPRLTQVGGENRGPSLLGLDRRTCCYKRRRVT
jgi:hypothetical protein